MRLTIFAALLLATLAGLPTAETPPHGAPQAPPAAVVQWWSSSEDGAARLAPQPELRFAPIDRPADGGVVVDDGTEYQSVLGLGSSLEHSTCYSFRNWSRSYNAWVTMIDHEGKPNVSGFHECDPTIIVLNRKTLQPEYRADYYIYGQFMKFVAAGAVRIASSAPAGAPAHVAFRNPDGHLVLVAANPDSRARPLVVEWKGRIFSATLAATSVATFRWRL